MTMANGTVKRKLWLAHCHKEAAFKPTLVTAIVSTSGHTLLLSTYQDIHSLCIWHRNLCLKQRAVGNEKSQEGHCSSSCLWLQWRDGCSGWPGPHLCDGLGLVSVELQVSTKRVGSIDSGGCLIPLNLRRSRGQTLKPFVLTGWWKSTQINHLLV